MSAKWNNQAIFISSTFRDMQSERDYLNKVVFPELEEKLRAKHCHLEPIDLRWGIFNDENLQAADKEIRILKVCLDEIDRSRPFIIVLLGDRYGWVPPRERMEKAAREAGYRHQVNDRSVTALEIEYGVINTEQQAHRSYFFFRRPLPYERMPASLRAEYSDQYSDEGSGNYIKLEELKRRIQTLYGCQDLAGAARVYEYTAEWDEQEERVCGLEEFGALVSRCIISAFESELQEPGPASDSGTYAAERELLDQFIESRYYLPADLEARMQMQSIRQESISCIKSFLLSPGPYSEQWGICLTGEPGFGKSTVFARIHRELQEDKSVILLANSAGVGASAVQYDRVLLRWIEELRLHLGQKLPSRNFSSSDEILKEFAALMYQAAPLKRVVVLIDALNEMSGFDYVRHLTWLPEPWPANARLLVTSIPGKECQRPGVKKESLEDLSIREAQELCSSICRRYHKELPEPVREAILSIQDQGSQHAYRNPLWLLLAVDEMITIDADDFRLIECYPGSPDLQIKAFMMDMVKEFPREVPSMFQGLFQRLEEIYGIGWVSRVLGMIAAGRSGMREAELKGAYTFIYGEEWDELKFAGLRRYLRMHLVQRGEMGQWDFLHRQARQSAENRYLNDKYNNEALHDRIADFLEGLPEDNPVRINELMYHYIAADDLERAARHYSGELNDACLDSASDALAARAIRPQADAPGAGMEWLKALLDLDGLADRQRLNLCRRYMRQIGKRMKVNGSREDQEFTEMVFSASLGLYGKNSDIADFKYEFARSLEFVSSFKEARLDYEAANNFRMQAMLTLQQLLAGDPSNVEYQIELLEVYLHLAVIINQWQGDYRAMEAYGQAAQELLGKMDRGQVSEQVYTNSLIRCYSLMVVASLNHEKLDAAEEYQNRILEMELAKGNEAIGGLHNGIAAAYMQMGDLYKKGQKLNEAQAQYLKSIEVFERLILAQPDNSNHRWALARGYLRRGETLFALERLDEAEKSCRKGLEMRKALSRQFPDDLLFKSDSLSYFNSLGVVYLHQSKASEAQAVFEQRLELVEELIRQSPEAVKYCRDAAQNHRTLAELCHAMKDMQAAAAHYESGIAALEKALSINEEQGGAEYELQKLSLKHLFDFKMVEDEKASQIEDMIMLSRLYKDLGELYLEQGRLQAALGPYEKNVALLEKLAAQDGEETSYQGALADQSYQAGEIAEKLNRWAAAARYYDSNIQALEVLARQPAGRAPYLKNLAFVSQKAGDMQMAGGNYAAAADYYRQSRAGLLEIGIRPGTNAAYDAALMRIKDKMEQASGLSALADQPVKKAGKRQAASRKAAESKTDARAEADARAQAEAQAREKAEANEKKQQEAARSLIDQARQEVAHKMTRQSNARTEADRNIRYQKALAEWKSLSLLKRMSAPKPRPEDF